MPMNTTPRIGWSASAAMARCCARISHVFRLRMPPSRPVAQKTHPSAQPTCELRQSVYLAVGRASSEPACPSRRRSRSSRAAAGSGSGMRTASTSWPSLVRNRYLTKPSAACRRSTISSAGQVHADSSADAVRLRQPADGRRRKPDRPVPVHARENPRRQLTSRRRRAPALRPSRRRSRPRKFNTAGNLARAFALIARGTRSRDIRCASVTRLSRSLAERSRDASGARGHVGCRWSTSLLRRARLRLERPEWARVKTLSPLPDPPRPVQSYAADPAAARLGQTFYFDPRFSGKPPAGRDWPPRCRRPRPQGQPRECLLRDVPRPAPGGHRRHLGPQHRLDGRRDLRRQRATTANAAFFPLLYWNGRSDSLWSQALAVNESNISMNSSRLQDFDVIGALRRPLRPCLGSPRPPRRCQPGLRQLGQGHRRL